MSCGKPSERVATLDGAQIRYDLHRSAKRRKSISLIVEDGQLRVLAPKRTTLKQVDALLEQRAAWLRERLTDPGQPRLRDQLIDGGRLPLLGEPYAVVDADAPFSFDGCRFLADCSRADPKARAEEAERWLREFARAEFTERVARWSEPIAVRPKRIQIRDQKTRWGSASSKGTLSFNWRLIFAPPEIVDYVVVHELCHLRQPDHSPKYWALVKGFMPDAQQRRRQLRAIGESLRW